MATQGDFVAATGWGGDVTTADGNPAIAMQVTSVTEGAAIHPTFLRVGPWALSVVVASLFGLSFATSYAALYDYAHELQFSREFALAFPLVLDAVIVVLAVTLLLELALRRRTMTVRGRQIGLRLPTWPLLALWLYFAGSVAGNVGHAPPVLAAQLGAAAPPVSAALTFHLLLRLPDRATLLHSMAEAFEERGVEEKARAAVRKARCGAIKSGSVAGAEGAPGDGKPAASKQRSRADAGWLGVSPRTGRRRLGSLLDDDPLLAETLSRD
jgi:Protein of unknown function (DUF2637)